MEINLRIGNLVAKFGKYNLLRGLMALNKRSWQNKYALFLQIVVRSI